ncbi:hypothetical protein R6Q57_028352 [Mikania cordata]
MSQRRGDTYDIDPKLEEYKNKYLKELRGGCFKIRFSENTLKCPFCPNSRDYSYKDLLRHSSRIVRESKNASFKDKVKHMGLIEYLESDFHAKLKCIDSTDGNTTPKQNLNEEIYVWPWMAVVANIPVEYKNGRYAGDSGKKLKDDWAKMGYNPVKVHPLWNWQGHSGLAVVEFGETFAGLCQVMMFMKDFEVNKHGRKDWFDKEKGKDDKLYAWIATYEDYNAYGLVGDYLKKNGNLKTVADVQKENELKGSKLIMGLKTLIDEKNKKSEEMNSEIRKTDTQLLTVMKQKEVMTENFNRCIRFKLVS